MTQIIACIDGSHTATAVCDASAWISQRLNAPLKLLHVLDKSEYPTEAPLSGNIGLGTREHLLEEMVQLDEQRSKLALEQGKHMLAAAKARASDRGAVEVTTQQRHGSLMDTLVEFEEDTRVLVIGRQGESHDNMAHAIGSQLESVIRTLHRPIFVSLPDFKAPQRFMIAYDASVTAKKALNSVIESDLLKGLDCHLVMVGTVNDSRLTELDKACKLLTDAGFNVTPNAMPGEVQPTLQQYQKKNQIDLMVMGAYGHSIIRQFLVGSNTTKMLSMSDIPLILLR
jgi:nucleotide-binding universal stress UspA family protein